MTRPRESKTALHACLAEIARRSLEIHGASNRHVAPTQAEVETIREAVYDVTCDAIDVLGIVVDRVDGPGSVAETLRTMASLARRDLRNTLTSLEMPPGERVDRVVATTLSARDRVAEALIAIESELAGALGMPTRLAATRYCFQMLGKRRERARHSLAADLAGIARQAEAHPPIVSARELCSRISTALLDVWSPVFEADERDALRSLCSRGLRVLWLVAPNRRPELVQSLMSDAESFAAILSGQHHTWPSQHGVAA